MLPKDDCFQANRLQMLATIEMLSVLYYTGIIITIMEFSQCYNQSLI